MTTEMRIARLERANRRLTAALCFIILAAGATLLMAAKKPAVVSAERIELLDSAGAVRIKLYERTSGIGTSAPTLDFVDSAGKPRMRLTMVDGDEKKCGGGSPAFEMGDKKGFLGNAFLDECQGSVRMNLNGKPVVTQ
jgi:hypothetical protein